MRSAWLVINGCDRPNRADGGNHVSANRGANTCRVAQSADGRVLTARAEGGGARQRRATSVMTSGNSHVNMKCGKVPKRVACMRKKSNVVKQASV
ncbi:hypothetical protein EVAR_64357_1 [Eumeta japonica]|uniref:Uncharacterized protein n=1 Tax=Eumeta variegata TaxID=151549 RepID=A0A4C1ZQL0_EUMVA|nr:hypothetical protein EVAR_64357_1 [Eumeta japonica]